MPLSIYYICPWLFQRKDCDIAVALASQFGSFPNRGILLCTFLSVCPFVVKLVRLIAGTPLAGRLAMSRVTLTKRYSGARSLWLHTNILGKRHVVTLSFKVIKFREYSCQCRHCIVNCSSTCVIIIFPPSFQDSSWHRL